MSLLDNFCFHGTFQVVRIGTRGMMVLWLQYINSVGLYDYLLVSYLFIFSCSLSTIHLYVFVAHL